MIIANKELLDDFVQKHANAVKPLNKKLTTRKEYDETKARVEELIPKQRRRAC